MLISQIELRKNQIELTTEELDKKLVHLGHEVEAIEVYENDKLVVGKVLTCEKHPEADRLNVTTVDIGATEPVQIVCGAPDVAKDQFVIVATIGAKFGDFKIKKEKLRGQISQGMICSLAELGLSESTLTEADKDGIFTFETSVQPGENALKALGLEDKILELGLTANRGDCQSYFGVIRDLKALAEEKYEPEAIKLEAQIENPFTVENNDPKSTVLFSSYIADVKNTTSPMWLKIFLAKHNIKTQDIIVDIANYVLLQTGIPLHTYDANKIDEKITIEVLNDSEKYVALDEKEYQLPKGRLVIKDANKTVSLASVMGSDGTKITPETNTILLEAGKFDPVNVRKTATVLGNKTDASQRGEKGVDFNQIKRAMALYMTTLKSEQANIKYSEINQSNDVNLDTKEVTLLFENIKKVLGIEVTSEKVEQILTNLHFNTVTKNDFSITVTVPTWRFDISNDHDLIEEVIRIISMEELAVSSKLGTFIAKDKIITNPKIRIERELEQIALKSGLNQVITYSLVNEKMLEEFGGDKEMAIELMMPLSQEHRYYRQNIISSLVNTAKYNFDRQQKTVNIFEIANTYTKNEDNLNEEYHISGLVAGQKETYYANEKTNYDFYDLKAVVMNILNHYNLNYEIVATTNELDQINKYAHADILVDGKYVGFIGKKHPEYFKKIKQDVYVFTINLALIEDQLQAAINYEIVSSKPNMERDITITSSLNTNYHALINTFSNIKYLGDIKFKDVYSGDKIEKDTKATTFTLTFTDANETLESTVIDEEIEKIENKAIELGFIIKK